MTCSDCLIGNLVNYCSGSFGLGGQRLCGWVSWMLPIENRIFQWPYLKGWWARWVPSEPFCPLHSQSRFFPTLCRLLRPDCRRHSGANHRFVSRYWKDRKIKHVVKLSRQTCMIVCIKLCNTRDELKIECNIKTGNAVAKNKFSKKDWPIKGVLVRMLLR